MNVIATPVFATWAFVQAVTNMPVTTGCAASGTTCTVSITPTSGNTLVAFGAWGGSTGAASFSGCGGTWSTDKSVNDATNGESASVGHATGIASGACTVTVTMGSACAAGNCGAAVAEYSGLTGSPSDVFQGQRSACSATANSCTSGSATTTVANDAIIGFFFEDTGKTGSFAVGTSPLAFNAARVSLTTATSIVAFLLEDVNQPSATSTAATAAGPAAASSALSFMLSFKQSAAGAASPCLRSLLGVGCDAS